MKATTGSYHTVNLPSATAASMLVRSFHAILLTIPPVLVPTVVDTQLCWGVMYTCPIYLLTQTDTPHCAGSRRVSCQRDKEVVVLVNEAQQTLRSCTGMAERHTENVHLRTRIHRHVQE